MNFNSIIGFTAAILTTIGYFPQLIKAIKTKQTKDISLWMYILMVTGIISWLTYGLLKTDWPIIFANLTALLMVVPILVLKLIYK